MKIRKIAALGMIALIGSTMLTGCGAASENSKVDLNAMSIEELTAMAKKEGKLESVGMPDNWANWGETWQEYTDKYQIEHVDTDMSSAEELSLFEAEKANATKDIGDVGQSFGPVAEQKGLTKPYKTSYWESVPDYAKDDNGDWMIAYYGTMSFIINKDKVSKIPTSFQDILEGDYMVTIGDPVTGTSSQCAVLSAAMAFGGGEDNLQPGIDFYTKLAEQGRLDKGEFSIARLEKGEIAVGITWDYLSLGYRDSLVESNPNADYEVCIPSDGAIQSGYTTVINAYSKRPAAAALAREYIFSDEGQINLAKGYARPIRSDVKMPEDVQAKLLPDEQYTNARMIQDNAAWEKSVDSLKTLWTEQVIAKQQ